MPTYQYACTACGHQLEAVQSFSDAPLTQCPACEGRLRKLFSAVGVVFKGSGFYRTDSRAGAKNGAGRSGRAKEPAASTSSSNGSSDSSSGTAATGSNGSASSSSGSSGSGSSGSSTSGAGSSSGSTAKAATSAA